jgi:general secretion pathway protein B
MSYILEALKKAQAERQLGNAPTLHAPQVQTAPPGAAASRKPLAIGLGAGALVAALGALLVWQRTPAPAPSPAAGAAAMPAVAGPAAVPAAPAVPTAAGPGLAANAPAGAARPAAGAALNTLEVSAPPAPEPVPAPPSPSAPVAARSAHVAAAPAHAAPSGAGRAGNDTPATAAPARSPAMAEATAAPAPRAAPAPAPAAPAAAAPEDSLPYLRQLPDTIQRDIPRVTFGGYMYSANPADRLLLVDKTLRHEGEEVGPGLVLEKLLPKAAVMNFRGIRYRVAY